MVGYFDSSPIDATSASRTCAGGWCFGSPIVNAIRGRSLGRRRESDQQASRTDRGEVFACLGSRGNILIQSLTEFDAQVLAGRVVV